VCNSLLLNSPSSGALFLSVVTTNTVFKWMAPVQPKMAVEYHANGGGGSWHANRHTSGQLSFEGSWTLLLNNNSRELDPITDCSDSK